jgi:hypothetical protein
LEFLLESLVLHLDISAAEFKTVQRTEILQDRLMLEFQSRRWG